MELNPDLRAALAACDEDRVVFDLAGIEEQYRALLRELPGVAVRFAMKACPVDEVISSLAALGAGCDAASPREIEQAVGCGVPVDRVHYGNTVKSDRNIADAFGLGVRDFATDSVQDVHAIAANAPGSRVFCRIATSGDGALWGLSHKFGCSIAEAVRVLCAARDLGLGPAGLSVHVGSQQMSAGAWRDAFDLLAEAVELLGSHGIALEYINLGGGLPALGYLDQRGRPLHPPLDKIFATIREGRQRLEAASDSPAPPRFLIEPGRHLVADHGVIRAQVSRLASREVSDGERQHWLYLTCGKFSGLYETDKLRFPLVFPEHETEPHVPAVVAGPTCDSDDVYGDKHSLVSIPSTLKSGDPVWITSCGAYSISYAARGFNGFAPLPHATIRSTLVRLIEEHDWDAVTGIESGTYLPLGLSEGREALVSRGRLSPGTCFVVEAERQVAGYVLALPYPAETYPDLGQPDIGAPDPANLHLHDMAVAAEFRGRGHGTRMLGRLVTEARRLGYEQISLVTVGGSDSFWSARGFRPRPEVAVTAQYGPDATYMTLSLESTVPLENTVPGGRLA
jgi:ornithine decarboxylase